MNRRWVIIPKKSMITINASADHKDQYSIITSRNFKKDGYALNDILHLHPSIAVVLHFYNKDGWTEAHVSRELINVCIHDECFHAVSQLLYDRRLIHHRTQAEVEGLMGWNKSYMDAYYKDRKKITA